MKRIPTFLFSALIFASCVPQAVVEIPSGTGSNNFSGYERTGDTYTSVGASWQAPSIAFGAQGRVLSMSSEWIGIGGVLTAPIVQVGTMHSIMANSTTAYEAFYELFPSAQVVIKAGKVLPGDVVNASVTCASNCMRSQKGQMWTLSIEDVTQNWRWSRTVSFVSDLSSAEVIEEDSTRSRNTLFPFPNFGTVTFQNITINGANPNLLTSEKVYMLARGGGTSNPSDPNATGDGFSVCWGDDRIFVSCSVGAPFESAANDRL